MENTFFFCKMMYEYNYLCIFATLFNTKKTH